jgi:hypothetical protein
VNGHVEVNVNVSWRRQDWGRLLLDRLKLANDSPHSCFDIASDGLEIHRRAWRAAHHDRPPSENADAKPPPKSPGIPVVEIAPKYLTSDRNAAEMSAALAMLEPWLALGPLGCFQQPGGPLSPS